MDAIQDERDHEGSASIRQAVSDGEEDPSTSRTTPSRGIGRCEAGNPTRAFNLSRAQRSASTSSRPRLSTTPTALFASMAEEHCLFDIPSGQAAPDRGYRRRDGRIRPDDGQPERGLPRHRERAITDIWPVAPAVPGRPWLGRLTPGSGSRSPGSVETVATRPTRAWVACPAEEPETYVQSLSHGLRDRRSRRGGRHTVVADTLRKPHGLLR
jgi:hypothetical protein